MASQKIHILAIDGLYAEIIADKYCIYWNQDILISNKLSIGNAVSFRFGIEGTKYTFIISRSFIFGFMISVYNSRSLLFSTRIFEEKKLERKIASRKLKGINIGDIICGITIENAIEHVSDNIL